jgi:hypothetical protein
MPRAKRRREPAGVIGTTVELLHVAGYAASTMVMNPLLATAAAAAGGGFRRRPENLTRRSWTELREGKGPRVFAST